MKLSTKNSVEPEVKQMTKVLETLRDSEEETAISNANFIALSEDLRGREEQEKYTEDKQTKELVERLGEYEQEIYEKDRLIQLLQNEIDSNRQVVKK
jgi:hypothetical protein